MKFEKLHSLLTEEDTSIAKKLDDLYNTDTLVKKYIDTVQIGGPIHDDAKEVVRTMIRADELDMPELVRFGRMIMAAAVKHVKKTGAKMDRKQFNILKNKIDKEWKESK